MTNVTIQSQTEQAEIMVVDYLKSLWHRYNQCLPKERRKIIVPDITSARTAYAANPTVKVIVIQGMTMYSADSLEMIEWLDQFEYVVEQGNLRDIYNRFVGTELRTGNGDCDCGDTSSWEQWFHTRHGLYNQAIWEILASQPARAHKQSSLRAGGRPGPPRPVLLRPNTDLRTQRAQGLRKASANLLAAPASSRMVHRRIALIRRTASPASHFLVQSGALP